VRTIHFTIAKAPSSAQVTASVVGGAPLVKDRFDLDERAHYGPAGPPWDSFGGEQQAKIVDHWFAGAVGYAKVRPTAPRLPMDVNDPYFTYISNNIRMGQM
jgi:hypothetical protein